MTGRILFSCIWLLFFLAPAYPDIVYLKSGEKVEGKVTKDAPKRVFIVVDTDLGLVADNFAREEVEKVETFDEGYEIVKRYAEASSLYAKAKRCVENSDYYDAMENLRKVVELNPRCAEAHFALGLVYVQIGYTVRAKDSLESALGLFKSSSKQTDKIAERIKNAEKELAKLGPGT
jgi:tetratricopeptide (TPR) repeat protein